ncbi:MAG: hypothetical protein HY378_01820 [Candidatus Brennerbacteria bacterium]|nr:hypothetical protein [Candidatus Brennerbacteria bacterium]
MPDGQETRLREQFIASEVPVGFPWRLFVFSLTLFVFSLFIFFGLKFGYAAYIDSRAEDLDRKIGELARQVSQEEQQNFIGFYSQVINLEKILNRHGFAANVFSFLEKNTLPQVFYNQAEFLSSGESLKLSGVAATNAVLVGQLTLFEGREEVSRVNLNQMSSSPGGAAFSITVSFREEFFQKPAL